MLFIWPHNTTERWEPSDGILRGNKKRREREQKKKIYLLWRIERFVSWIFVAIVACACVCVVCRLINNDDDDVQDGEDEFGLPKQVEQAGSVEA